MLATLWQIAPSIWLHPVLLTEIEADESYAKAAIASLLITAGLIFLLSVLLGELCTRLNLPSVLGDLGTGIILGGSVLSVLVFADVEQGANGSILHFLELATGSSADTMMSAYQFQMQDFINESANIGLLTLLFVTGLESDLEELIRVGPQAATVALTGVFLPLVGGAIALIYLFNVPTIPAIFAGAALTATSIGITAKVLQEIGHLQSDEGQIILGAAILDDILGIVVLALTLSLVETGSIEPSNLIMLVISAAVFVLLAILLNRYFCPIFTKNIERFDNPAALLLCSFAFLNAMALLAISFGLEALLGAFAAGLVLGGTSQTEKLMNLVQPFVYVYTTIFFVTIGASVNLSVLNPLVPENQEGLVIAGCLIAIAVIGKVIAGYAAFGDEPINRLAIGTGMIPRGEVGLVFAGLGASTGVLSESLDAAVLIMVVVTTLIAPILLRWVFPSGSEVLTPETAERFDEIEDAIGEKF
ncbi:MAG: cation:proton antiporter [Cyanobacteria bacterium P01_A01_bin.17]